jgi:hypothetical protein
LGFATSKEAHSLLGLSCATSNASTIGATAAVAAISRNTASVEELLTSGQLLAAATAASPSAAAQTATTSGGSGGGAAASADGVLPSGDRDQPYFQVRHTLALPRPNYLVQPKEVFAPRRPVTPPTLDIPEKEWQQILTDSSAASVPHVDVHTVHEAQRQARVVRSAEAGRRWRTQCDLDAAKRKVSPSDAERTVETIRRLGVKTAGRSFVEMLNDEARLTYCSNVRHATEDTVVLQPTPHTPRAASARAQRPVPSGATALQASRASVPRSGNGGGRLSLASPSRQVAATPRIGTGIAHHRPMKRPAVIALRSLWSKKTWSYEAGIGGGQE